MNEKQNKLNEKHASGGKVCHLESG